MKRKKEVGICFSCRFQRPEACKVGGGGSECVSTGSLSLLLISFDGSISTIERCNDITSDGGPTGLVNWKKRTRAEPTGEMVKGHEREKILSFPVTSLGTHFDRPNETLSLQPVCVFAEEGVGGQGGEGLHQSFLFSELWHRCDRCFCCCLYTLVCDGALRLYIFRTCKLE